MSEAGIGARSRPGRRSHTQQHGAGRAGPGAVWEVELSALPQGALNLIGDEWPRAHECQSDQPSRREGLARDGTTAPLAGLLEDCRADHDPMNRRTSTTSPRGGPLAVGGDSPIRPIRKPARIAQSGGGRPSTRPLPRGGSGVGRGPQTVAIATTTMPSAAASRHSLSRASDRQRHAAQPARHCRVNMDVAESRMRKLSSWAPEQQSSRNWWRRSESRPGASFGRLPCLPLV